MASKDGNGTATPRQPALPLLKSVAKPDRRRGSRDPSTLHCPISAHEARRVAVEAICDHRTVLKYLQGDPQTAMMRERIERALRACGFGHLIDARARAVATAATNARTNGSGRD